MDYLNKKGKSQNKIFFIFEFVESQMVNWYKMVYLNESDEQDIKKKSAFILFIDNSNTYVDLGQNG